jgi:hypothetical protein
MTAEGSQKPQQGATGSQGLKRRRRCAELQGAKTVDGGSWALGQGSSTGWSSSWKRKWAGRLEGFSGSWPAHPTLSWPGGSIACAVQCVLYQSQLAVPSVACLLPHALAKDLLAWARRSTIIQKSIQPMNTRAPSFAPVMLSQPSRATSVPLCPSCSKKTHSSTRSG